MEHMPSHSNPDRQELSVKEEQCPPIECWKDCEFGTYLTESEFSGDLDASTDSTPRTTSSSISDVELAAARQPYRIDSASVSTVIQETKHDGEDVYEPWSESTAPIWRGALSAESKSGVGDLHQQHGVIQGPPEHPYCALHLQLSSDRNHERDHSMSKVSEWLPSIHARGGQLHDEWRNAQARILSTVLKDWTSRLLITEFPTFILLMRGATASPVANWGYYCSQVPLKLVSDIDYDAIVQNNDTSALLRIPCILDNLRYALSRASVQWAETWRGGQRDLHKNEKVAPKIEEQHQKVATLMQSYYDLLSSSPGFLNLKSETSGIPQYCSELVLSLPSLQRGERLELAIQLHLLSWLVKKFPLKWSTEEEFSYVKVLIMGKALEIASAISCLIPMDEDCLSASHAKVYLTTFTNKMWAQLCYDFTVLITDNTIFGVIKYDSFGIACDRGTNKRKGRVAILHQIANMMVPIADGPVPS
ncbi:hypothetical protein BDZ91DRAFT_835326 [Kalaharituber pfeilii]|nr:hypothetical protein BDZ91DRAFT_835326 [Kalaharituber pfeilii]